MSERQSGWREYDSFETRIHRVGGEMAECVEKARAAGASADEIARIVSASQQMVDVLRSVRRSVQDRVIEHKGHRR